MCDVFVWDFDERVRNRIQHVRDVEVAGLVDREGDCMCIVCARDVTEDYIRPDSKVGAGLDVNKACEEQKEHT